MKYLLRVFLFNTFGLWLVSQVIPTLVISGGWQVFLLAGFILSILMLVVKPVLKILFIPINILTLGLFSWFVNVMVLYLLTLLFTDVAIHAWNFPGLSWQGITISPRVFPYVVSLIITSLALTFVTNVLHSMSES